ncbi:hypothetical protein [Streptomyces sp. NPDC059909]|uniref:hypothetical protein n=1 Tax=Streptomyces sp. NPDC059909 TaxID=3346998 RepID=UPI0036575482
MNRSARCAVVRAVLVVLLALIAHWGTQAGAGAAAAPLQGTDDLPPASSAPADPAGEGQQETAETEQPAATRRAERRGAQARDRQAPVGLPRPDHRGAAAPVTPPPALHPTRSVVLRC